MAVRSRSGHELRGRLRRAGFEDDEIDQALADLEDTGLVDDRRFAEELVRSRAGRRLEGNRAIRTELRGKGVSQDVADEVLATVEGDEADRAFRLAASRAPRLASVQPEAAFRRLVGVLVRRGYAPDLARRAAANALGTDRNHLGP